MSPIPRLDLGTACVLFFALWMILKKPNIRLYPLLSIVLLYTFFITCPALFGNVELYSSSSSIVLRLFRFIILLLLMIGIGFTNYYDERKFTNALSFFSVIVASYAILQSIVFRLFGIKLRNLFLGADRGGTVFTSSLGEYDSVYRPPSLFQEPSGVTYYLTPILCYVLFHQKETSYRDLFIATIVSIGILVSTSGQGLLVIALCWGLWIITRIRTMKFGGIIIVIICAFLFFHYYDIGYTVSRIITQDKFNAVDARSGGFEFVKGLDPEHLVFGNGYGNYVETIYFSSVAEIIFCTGLLGLLLIAIMYFSFFIQGKPYQKVLVLASIVLMAGGGIYTATYLCLYLPLLIKQGNTPVNREIINSI